MIPKFATSPSGELRRVSVWLEVDFPAPRYPSAWCTIHGPLVRVLYPNPTPGRKSGCGESGFQFDQLLKDVRLPRFAEGIAALAGRDEFVDLRCGEAT